MESVGGSVSDLDKTREGVVKYGNGWSKYGVIVWGLIYVGDCIRDLARAIREKP